MTRSRHCFSRLSISVFGTVNIFFAKSENRSCGSCASSSCVGGSGKRRCLAMIKSYAIASVLRLIQGVDESAHRFLCPRPLPTAHSEIQTILRRRRGNAVNISRETPSGSTERRKASTRTRRLLICSLSDKAKRWTFSSGSSGFVIVRSFVYHVGSSVPTDQHVASAAVICLKVSRVPNMETAAMANRAGSVILRELKRNTSSSL